MPPSFHRSIDYSGLIPVLVETNKEQQKQIAAVTSRAYKLEKLLKNKKNNTVYFASSLHSSCLNTVISN